MKAIGVTVSDAGEVTDRIYQATGGLPSLVQDCCQAILERDDVNQDRDVTVERLEHTLATDAFAARLMFLFDQVRAPLARLVGYLAAYSSHGDSSSPPEILFREVLTRVRSVGVQFVDDAVLERALRILVLYNVLLPQQASERLGGSTAYLFSTGRLWELIRTQLTERGRTVIIRTLVEQCKAGYLWSPPGGGSTR
jgi:hypothetical protein